MGLKMRTSITFNAVRYLDELVSVYRDQLWDEAKKEAMDRLSAEGQEIDESIGIVITVDDVQAACPNVNSL